VPNKKKIFNILFRFFLMLVVIAPATATAQYRMPIYSDYLTDNYYILHPAMAGAHYGGMKIRTSFRTQWIELANAPSLQTLNIHTRAGDKSGIGGMFFNDKNGFHSNTGIQATYAHHINFYRAQDEINQLSFGLSVGGSFHRHDQTAFSPSFEAVIKGEQVNSSSIYMDVGIMYNLVSFYTHLTIQNLVFQGKNIGDQVLLESPMRFLVSAGNFFEITPKWALEPSLLADYVQYVDRPNLDISLKSHHSIRQTQLWLGTSYRKGLTDTQTKSALAAYSESFNQITLLTGIKHQNWIFSYAYTVGLGDIIINNSGFHQLTIGIDFLSDKYRPTVIRGIL
jgi:type IX secretion system PorP/SprF family membrane protein